MSFHQLILNIVLLFLSVKVCMPQSAQFEMDSKSLMYNSIATCGTMIRYWDNEKQQSVSRFQNKYLVNLVAQPIKDIRIGLSLHLNYDKAIRNIKWIPDYSYYMMRIKYQPNTFGYGYVNNMPNKFNNKYYRFKDLFLGGYYFVSYFIKVPHNIIDWVYIDETTFILPLVELEYSPKYLDGANTWQGRGLFSGKPVFITSLKYVIAWSIYFQIAFRSYLDPHTKNPWDSDFEYCIGLDKWSHHTLRLSYSKYYNAFPWNEHTIESNLLNGELKIAYNYVINYKKRRPKF